MLHVDLRAVSVHPGTRVWRLFPGSDYKFLNHFFKSKTAFLDLPSMVFPDGPLKPTGDLLARMLASAKVKELLLSRDPDAANAVDWKAFLKSRRTSPRMRLVAAVINFYQEAKQGDYIVVPTTLSNRRVHLGRIASDDITSVFYRYGDHPIPAREVTWVGSVDEGKISTPLSASLRQQHAFSLVERSHFIEVFALVNGSYSFGDRTVATIYNREADFLDADSALMGVLSKLSASACAALARDGKIGDILAAVVSAAPIEFTCSQESDIHSEGFTRFISSAITPMVISAVLACLLACDLNKTPEQIKADLADIVVVNSFSPYDPCIGPVTEATRMILSGVDIETTYQLCRAAHDAGRRAGLEPSAQGLVKP